MEKLPYIKPDVEIIQIDTHISVVLMSSPETSPGDPLTPPDGPPMG